MISRKEAYKLSETYRNENRAEFFVGEDLNALLFEAIKKRNITKVKHLIDYVIQNNKSINLKNLQAAVSQADLEMIQLIMPHCGFSKPSDLYIPRELVIIPVYKYRDCVQLLLNWNFTVHPDSTQDEEFIYRAVENGYLPIVEQLLDHGVDVNMVNSSTGLNLLTIACLLQHHEIIKSLLKHNADVNVITSGKNKKLNEHSIFSYYIRAFTEIISSGDSEDDLCNVTCLHIAVFNSDLITTKLLLKYGAKIISDPKFFYVTYLAIHNGNKDIFRIFLDYGVNAADVGPRRTTFLHSCVQSNYEIRNYLYYHPKKCRLNSRYAITKWLLINGADIHLQTPNNSLVFEAIANGHPKIAQLFLDYNPDVQYINSDGNTALHKAVENDFDAEFIKTLLKLNFPVNIANDKGLTPLLIICQRSSQDQLTIIKALLHNNVNVNCTDKRLMTPLHFACDDSNLEFVTLLLEKGANLNAKNNDGETPLHYACKHGSNKTQSIIKLLLKHDANIEAMDRRGRTPLFTACERNNNVIVKLLLENNAYVNYKDSGNSTPLHIAMEKRCVEVACSLIKYGGANSDILDNNNHTPLQIAEENLLDSQNTPEQHRSYPYLNRYFYNGNNKYVEFCFKKYRDIVNVIVNYAVQLKIAGLKVNQKIIENNSTFIESWFKARYVKEIEQMNMENIGTTNITFYDLLTKNIHFLSRFVKNEVILEALENDFYKTKFPLYINIIRSRFREAKIRCKLINSAREYFRKNVYENLPDECIDLIFSYFSIDELFIFIGAKIPFNGESSEECHENSD